MTKLKGLAHSATMISTSAMLSVTSLFMYLNQERTKTLETKAGNFYITNDAGSLLVNPPLHSDRRGQMLHPQEIKLDLSVPVPLSFKWHEVKTS